jgi:hypothetical protein
MPRFTHNQLAALLLALAALATLALLFFLDPAAHAFYPRCPLHALTGLACPTCGGLRAAHLLLHGDFRAAYTLNPFLFYALPVALLFALPPVRRRIPALPWLALAALLAAFLWRNFLS